MEGAPKKNQFDPESKPLMSGLENLRMQSTVAREAADERAQAEDDPHDSWSQESFETYEEQKGRLKDLVTELIKETGEEPKPLEVEPAPAVAETSMREQITPTKVEMAEATKHLPKLHEFKGSKPSMRDQLSPTLEEIRAGTVKLGRLDEFKGAKKEGSAAKENVVDLRSEREKRRGRRKKAALGIGLAAASALTAEQAAAEYPGARVLDELAHAKYSGHLLEDLATAKYASPEKAKKGDKRRSETVQPTHTSKKAEDAMRPAPSVEKTRDAAKPEHPPITVAISKRGEGAIKLFTKLKAEAKKQYQLDDPMLSPEVKALLTESADTLAKKYGFVDEKGASRVMRAGDTFSLSAEGKFDWHVGGATYAKPEAKPIDREAEKTRELNRQELEKHKTAEPHIMSSGAPEIAISAPALEAPPVAPRAEPAAYGTAEASMTNRHGVRIDPTMPAIFKERDHGRDEFSVYGGSAEKQQMLAKAYLMANPGSEVRIALPDAAGTETIQRMRVIAAPNAEPVVEFTPEESRGGWLGGIFGAAPRTIDPETFTRLITSSGQ